MWQVCTNRLHIDIMSVSCPEGFYYGWRIWDPEFYPPKNDEAEQMNGWSKTILQKSVSVVLTPCTK